MSEFVKLIKRDGWYLNHHGKEHDAYIHDKKDGILRVPRHPSKELKAGTANQLLKDAGLK